MRSCPYLRNYARPAVPRQAFFLRVALDISDGLLQLIRLVDEDFPASLAPRRGEAAAFAGEVLQGMQVCIGQRSRGAGFQVTGDRRECSIVGCNDQMGVVISDAAGVNVEAREIDRLLESRSDRLALLRVESHRRILQRASPHVVTLHHAGRARATEIRTFWWGARIAATPRTRRNRTRIPAGRWATRNRKR